MRRTTQAPKRKAAGIRPGWPGEKCPAGSHVAFESRKGRIEGKVVELRLRQAVVAGGDDGRWRVDYRLLEVLERSGNTISLAEVYLHATEVLAQFQTRGVLGTGWHVDFDLAPRRAAQCMYNEERIQLAVGHCLKADPHEVRNTVLHEIAHAIAGPGHHHDEHWKRIARQIGCTAERCTRVKHSAGRWIGRCGCGGRIYRRQRLTRALRFASCRKCGQRVHWTGNTTGDDIE